MGQVAKPPESLTGKNRGFNTEVYTHARAPRQQGYGRGEQQYGQGQSQSYSQSQGESQGYNQGYGQGYGQNRGYKKEYQGYGDQERGDRRDYGRRDERRQQGGRGHKGRKRYDDDDDFDDPILAAFGEIDDVAERKILGIQKDTEEQLEKNFKLQKKIEELAELQVQIESGRGVDLILDVEVGEGNKRQPATLEQVRKLLASRGVEGAEVKARGTEWTVKVLSKEHAEQVLRLEGQVS